MSGKKEVEDTRAQQRVACAPSIEPSFRPRAWFWALILVALTVAAYQPVWHAGFVWDDDDYVTRNTLLTAPDGLQRIWFSPPQSDSYFPMVNTTLWVEHRLWGLNPYGYHCVNVLLHSLNALLVFAVLRKLAMPGAWLAAAIWAVHPVNVESVAWITELKNTQSTLFYLLTLLAWMKFTEAGTVRPWRFYALALLLYGPSLFSKATACTLPAAMLLVLWLRHEPIDRSRLLETLPFLSYGIAAGLLAVQSEVYLGSYAAAVRYSCSGLARLLVASRALWFYATKLAWPTGLTFSYPRWQISLHDPRQYGWLIACIAVALLLWWRRHAVGRGPIVAAVFFVAALSPLLGFIPVYTFRFSFVADHYEYVASIALIALFAAAASSRAQAWQFGHDTRCALSACLLLVLGTLTWRQAAVYRDVETLWRDTLTKNPQSWIAYNNLGYVQAQKGNVDAAIGNYQRSLQLNPDNERAHYNLGNVFLDRGHPERAVPHYEEALRLTPNFAEAHNNLGKALFKLGDTQGAIRHLREAVRLKADSADGHYNLAIALEKLGRIQEAIRQYEEALRIRPDFVEARSNLARALAVP